MSKTLTIFNSTITAIGRIALDINAHQQLLLGGKNTISDTTAKATMVMKMTIKIPPVSFESLNLFRARVVYKAKATKMSAMIVYSIDPDWILMGLCVLAPSTMFLKNQGMPRENKMAIVFAPKELETPKAPSP